jgi:hypothetical protein
MVRKVKDVDYAHAFAKAIAVASTTCTSSGNAWGCASAYAHASAWATATASAHAKAWAAAKNACYCDGKLQIVESDADAEAFELKKLVAKVTAAADAYTCVEPTDPGDVSTTYDNAAQTCIQDIYATVLAKVRFPLKPVIFQPVLSSSFMLLECYNRHLGHCCSLA